MKNLVTIILVFTAFGQLSGQTGFELDVNRKTPYEVEISWYSNMIEDFKEIKLQRMFGNTGQAAFENVTLSEYEDEAVNFSNLYFIDENSYQDVSYYRVRFIGAHGDTTYSDIKTVEGMGSMPQMQICPNPVFDHLKLRFDKNYTGVVHISVLNSSGKEVLAIDQDMKGKNSISVNQLEAIPPGLYFVYAKHENTFYNVKFFKS